MARPSIINTTVRRKAQYTYTYVVLMLKSEIENQNNNHHNRSYIINNSMLSSNTKCLLISSYSHRSSLYQINSRTIKSLTKKGRGKLTQSSRKWLQRHEKDEYVKRAKSEKSPSRASFKLEEILVRINNKNNNKIPKDFNIAFLGVGNTVIDLGVSEKNLYYVDLISSTKIEILHCYHLIVYF